jgi:hypothetical protein
MPEFAVFLHADAPEASLAWHVDTVAYYFQESKLRITAGLFSRPGFVGLYLVVISLAAHSHHWLADGHCLRSCKARQVYAFLTSTDFYQRKTHHDMAGATFLQRQASFIWHTTMYDMIVQALQPCQLWCWYLEWLRLLEQPCRIRIILLYNI